MTNGGATLSANDFANTPVQVPTTPANLLQVTYSASINGSGAFGIFALQGQNNTIYTNGNNATAFYTNIPDGTGMIRLATVVVPEPLSLLVVVGAVLVLRSRYTGGGLRSV